MAGGYVRFVGTQLQVDADGGGDGWVTVASVGGWSAITVRYLSGGSPTDIGISSSAGEDIVSAKQGAQLQTAEPVPLDRGWHALDGFGTAHDPIVAQPEIHGII